MRRLTRLFTDSVAFGLLGLTSCATPAPHVVTTPLQGSSQTSEESASTPLAQGDKLTDDTPLQAALIAKRKQPIAQPLAVVAIPHSHTAAQAALKAGLEAMGNQQPALAVAHFNAVLATDYLTDGGRLNVYWFVADAAHKLHDARTEASALEGFVLAAQLLDRGRSLQQREMLARTTLSSMRVQDDPGHGRTPQNAILVEDVREPGSIMSRLTCGPAGTGRYVNLAIESVSKQQRRLVHRRATCGSTGRVLDLYFNVTYAKGPR